MTAGEQAINDVVQTISLAFTAMAAYIEKTQSQKNFARRGLATALVDLSNSNSITEPNKGLKITLLRNFAAELNGEAANTKPLPFTVNK